MASWAEGRLQDPGYKRFILAGLAWDWLCKQLEPYLMNVIEDLHRDLLTNGHTTPVCHTNASAYKDVKACLQLSCGSSVRLLDSCHVSGSVKQGWKNSKIELWETQPWSLALLFMDHGKVLDINTSAGHTDISGVLNVLQHCNRFTMNRNPVENIRVHRNKIVHHSSTFEVTEADFNKRMDDISNLLSDPNVAPHVTENGIDYLDTLKTMKLTITLHDEITVIRQLLGKMEERQALGIKDLQHSFAEFIDKHNDLKKALSKDLGAIRHSLEQQAVEQNHALKMKIIQALKLELINCYSRPDFRYVNPLLDNDETLGYFIESVFVEISLAQHEVKPILGKRGLEESIRQKGKPVQNINDMIPPPGGQRVLLTGFVGSGKTSLCLHWLHEWTCGPLDDNVAINNNIHLYDLVIFLRAGALESNIQQSLANVIESQFRQLGQKKVQAIEAALLLEPRTLIIIDGYNEVNKQQQVIVDDLISYKTFSNASVIITSRPNIFHGKIENWYDNLGFNLLQQIKFIKKFKLSIQKHQIQNFEAFEERFIQSIHARSMLTSPMIAMTTCTMVAEGEVVEFKSRVRNYLQMTEFFARRACFKYDIKSSQITEVMPALAKAAYTNLVENALFQFSRDDLCLYFSEDTLVNVIVKLGYLSVTKYILHSKTEFAYTFLHKSWSEFTAARHVMSLPIAERCTAVSQLFKSGPANLEVLRFALGLCSLHEPENMPLLFKAAVEVIQQLDIDAETVRDEMETIRAADDDDGYEDISLGSCYLLQLLTDVDPSALTPELLGELSRTCAAIRRARIDKNTIMERVEGKIEMSYIDWSAEALYTGLLLTTHSAQRSLHSVREVRVGCESLSPHNAVTCLPATFAACAPSMTALININLEGLVWATELFKVCSGLVESGLRCLTHLRLMAEHNSDLNKVVGSDLGPVVQVIRAATQLTELRLSGLHCGEEVQLRTLCAAVGEATPKLTNLELRWCSVSAQQYSAVLVPALLRRVSMRGDRLQQVELVYERDKESKEREEWDSQRRELRKVAVVVKVDKS